MSLWAKPLAQVEFGDVEAFCAAGHREGVRLDYKRDVPSDLAPLIAAFANTLGGLIIVGVEEEGKTGRPRLPIAGIADRPGIEDTIISMAQDGVYPPVRPQVQRVKMPSPVGAPKIVLLIRVDESPEAPHAVERRRCIYERVEAQVRGYELAEVDRIAHLLSRRHHSEERREALVATSLRRAQDRLARVVSMDLPVLWASVTPYFVWRQLCTPMECWASYGTWARDATWGAEAQQVPDGVFSSRSVNVSLEAGPAWITDLCTAVECHGHVFCATVPRNTIIHRQNQQQGAALLKFLDLGATERELHAVLGAAIAMYGDPKVDRPGNVLVSLGVLQATGTIVIGSDRSEKSQHAFLDTSFRADTAMPVERLVTAKTGVAEELSKQLRFAFDVRPQP